MPCAGGYNAQCLRFITRFPANIEAGFARINEGGADLSIPLAQLWERTVYIFLSKKYVFLSSIYVFPSKKYVFPSMIYVFFSAK